MTALVTETDYQAQRRDLERAISYAEAEHHHAAFKAQTGAGTAEEAKKAKDHHEALKAQLADLNAAQRGAEVAAANQSKAVRAAAHAKLCKDVDAFVAKRLSLTKAILKHSEALAAAVSEHDQISREMRSHIHKQDYARYQLEGIDLAFENAVSPYSVTGAALALGGLQSSLIVGNRSFFDQLSAEDREARFAEQLRGNLKIIAPKEA